MPRSFLIDPVRKTIKPCGIGVTRELADRIGQAKYDATVSIELNYKLVEYSANVWPKDYSRDSFELSCKVYFGSAILVIHTDDEVTPEMVPIAFC